MKKCLLVLSVLAMTVTASATVLVYDLKESWTGMYVSTSGMIDPYKGTTIAYFLVEQTGPAIAELRVIWVYKKDKEAYYEDWGENVYIQAELEDGKEICVVSDAEEGYRLLLTGPPKIKKIAAYKESSCGKCHAGEQGFPQNIIANVPASLTGYGIWDEGDSYGRDMWTSTFSLKLNVKFTLEGHLREAFTADDAAYELLSFLEDEGYIITQWPP